MFKELKQYWKQLDIWEKMLVILLLPISIMIGIIYGLILIFWNKYGLAFICALILIGPNDSGNEAWEKGSALALLISLILLIRRAYKEYKKESEL